MPTMVSIIIPTLNEEAFLGDCLKSLAHEQCEIIVVDGGSTDRTTSIAEEYGANVVRLGTANRAMQMNAGARLAQGDLFLFFHADSRLPTGGIDAMRIAMRNPKVVGGSFSLAFFPDEPFYSFLAIGANVFCRMTRMIFGDRGMFIRPALFWQIGSFQELVIMEDAALATSMRELGKICILPDVVRTSARKYKNETKLQAIYRTMWAYSAYRLGVPPEKIKAGYYKLGRPDHSEIFFKAFKANWAYHLLLTSISQWSMAR
jgi:rSAM/selenodomain-associated transferase 2